MPHVSLRDELETRLLEIAALPTTTHPDDIPRPSDETIMRARIAAESLIDAHDRYPCRIHLSAGYDDEILFSLDGVEGRDIDLWMHSEDDTGHAGEAHWVADTKTEQWEGHIRPEYCGRLFPWLMGEGPLP